MFSVLLKSKVLTSALQKRRDEIFNATFCFAKKKVLTFALFSKL